jgi:endonuclease III
LENCGGPASAELPAPMLQALRAKVLEVYRRLVPLFGVPELSGRLDPVSELVLTILSQNTNDVNRDRAYDRLQARFPTWEAVRDADVREVVEAIRPAGLSEMKGPRIQEALRHITATQGCLTLDFLRDQSVPEAKAWLTSMKGVGPKTAAIVLLFSLGRPAFPVDTHVHRVSGRLGLIGLRVSADQAHAILEELVPENLYFQFHVDVIRHGREICRPKPRCEVCPLRDLCCYYATRIQPSTISSQPSANGSEAREHSSASDRRADR